MDAGASAEAVQRPADAVRAHQKRGTVTAGRMIFNVIRILRTWPFRGADHAHGLFWPNMID